MIARFVGVVGCLALAACAGSPPAAEGAPEPTRPSAEEALAERVFTRSEVDRVPRLLGCAYEGRTRRSYWITMTYIVDREGIVEKGSVASADGDMVARRDLIDRAKRVAETCRYEPGTIAGQPVRVRLKKTFKLSR